ncbi:uncharacterized protein [Oryza sativa Japonica Group]|uniref:Os06g0702200 protein n=3 Tax=Oryza TaxID=4527 RepID=Q5Z8X1_ORYSJ|nr:uncharacterized protein LOC4341975 [Oryza sativa Japonica Group]KAB8103743.1 hypothetical protein EE612_036328 [Oryza sativa]KAF2928334.1 hypothetical protein DAI22_06g271800 [Oryza sativa Japonica Group]BAD53783.1 unknown protein [Oryza sativa Japonica Group]BAF20403.1 Os06g0702200 [Oryza sativa Japonica Group]BAG99066.1 unnamed protein product [Oryza sativa Japonica Group]|eukprot:NP_001058489.1 Os06g0702200 [Oryza sativa Japonica Group]
MEPDASPTSTTSCSKQSKLPLALLTLECNSNKCFLFDPSTKQTRGATDMAAFFLDAATLAFENRGWLLMVQNYRHSPRREKTLRTVFLSTPATAGGWTCRCSAPSPVASSSSTSTPMGSHWWWPASRRPPIIPPSCPGDVYWTTYKNTNTSPPQQARHGRRRAAFTFIVDAALRGKQVVCADYRGRISVFDMTETAWRTPVPSPGWNWQEDHFLVTASGEGGGEEEEEEEVILVSCRRHDDQFCEFKFFKLDIAMAPSPLDAGDLDGFSWFLCRGRSSRLREEKGGRKVYTFCPDRLWGESRTIDLGNGKKRKMAPFNPRGLIEKSITNVYAHNLVDGVVEELLPASIVTEARHWVHSAVFSEPFA